MKFYLVLKHLERMNMNDIKVEVSEQVDGWTVKAVEYLIYGAFIYWRERESIFQSISSIGEIILLEIQARRFKAELNYPIFVIFYTNAVFG